MSRQYETEQEIKEVAQKISNFVNCHNDKEVLELGTEMAFDHRTLVQKSFKIFYGFLLELAAQHAAKRYDGRNEASCQLAVKILDAIREEDGRLPYLPFI